uniref:Uncharacterized protein n=1 Tax=Trichuris muris TaxID=70415 RepID=A0A5S6R1U3_TRIMR
MSTKCIFLSPLCDGKDVINVTFEDLRAAAMVGDRLLPIGAPFFCKKKFLWKRKKLASNMQNDTNFFT